MKKFNELNYYEILKIPINSSHFEIRQAYRDAISLYHEDSNLTYSLFSPEERDKILKKIEDAFSTLIDENKRAVYDEMLAGSGQTGAVIPANEKQYQASLRLRPHPEVDENHLYNRVKEKIDTEAVQNLSNELSTKGLISGSDLKKFREALGVDIREIHFITKISIPVLNAIEENRFDRLPPDIYLKNFLKSFSKILQLDPQKIIDGYFKTISLSRDADYSDSK